MVSWAYVTTALIQLSNKVHPKMEPELGRSRLAGSLDLLVASKICRCCLQLVFRVSFVYAIQNDLTLFRYLNDRCCRFLLLPFCIPYDRHGNPAALRRGHFVHPEWFSRSNFEFLSDMAEAEHLGVVFLVKIFLSEYLY